MSSTVKVVIFGKEGLFSSPSLVTEMARVVGAWVKRETTSNDTRRSVSIQMMQH